MSPRAQVDATEAINGRLEHLRGSALESRNLANYIARSLLKAAPLFPKGGDGNVGATTKRAQ